MMRTKRETTSKRIPAPATTGARLRRLRRFLDLSIGEASRRAKISQSLVYQIEAGTRALTPRTAARLLRVYGRGKP